MLFDLTIRILGEFPWQHTWTFDLSTGEFKHNWGTAEKLYKSEVLGRLFKWGDGDQNGSWWHSHHQILGQLIIVSASMC